MTANCFTMAKVFEKAMDGLKGLARDTTIEIHSQAEITRYVSRLVIAISPTRGAAAAVIPARHEKNVRFFVRLPASSPSRITPGDARRAEATRASSESPRSPRN